MWLTGFDAPCLHTMYVDKPMRGHGLMQAIARVNRVFKDKPGGLVVDYLGLAHELKAALANYTESGGKGRDGDRSGRGRRRDAGEIRDLLRHLPRIRLVQVETGRPAGAAVASCPRRRSMSWRRRTASSRLLEGGGRFVEGVCAWPCRMRRRWRSGTTWHSSRP